MKMPPVIGRHSRLVVAWKSYGLVELMSTGHVRLLIQQRNDSSYLSLIPAATESFSNLLRILLIHFIR